MGDGGGGSMIKELLQRLGAGAAAVILAAFAGGIAFVALAYALFAVLQRYVSPAGAAAITAGVFALVAAGIAVVIPKVAPTKRELATFKPKLDQRTLAIATEAGVAALGLAGDFLLAQRLKRREKTVIVRRKAEPVVVVERDGPDPREAALIKARRREEKALKAKVRAEKSRQRAEKKLRGLRLKRLTPHIH